MKIAYQANHRCQYYHGIVKMCSKSTDTDNEIFIEFYIEKTNKQQIKI